MNTNTRSTSAPRTGGANRRLTWLLGLGLVALIVAGLWPRALPVEVATVTHAPLAVTVNEDGETRIKNRYTIASPVTGLLRRITHKPGARIIAGETVLAELEPGTPDLLDARSLAQARARLRAAASARDGAAAQLAGARASHELATSDLTRIKQLAATALISKQELDAASAREVIAAQNTRAAEFSAQVATYELEQAKATLLRGESPAHADDLLPIIAPVHGQVLRVPQESSRIVTAGLPLIEIGDTTDLELRIEVLSRDGVAIRAGARVVLEQWGGPSPLEARVRLVEPAGFTKVSALGVEEQRVNVIADFVTPADARPGLGDGFRVEAHIVTWEGPHVLQLPTGALFRRGGRWEVYVLSAGRAQPRTVTIGHSNGLATEILGGLQEGEHVIVYPGDKITPGTRVRTIDSSPR